MQIKLCELNYANFTMLNKKVTKVTDFYRRLLIFVKKNNFYSVWQKVFEKIL